MKTAASLAIGDAFNFEGMEWVVVGKEYDSDNQCEVVWADCDEDPGLTYFNPSTSVEEVIDG